MSLNINTIMGSYSVQNNNSATSSIYNSLGDMSSIRTGAYRKLLNKYYSEINSTGNSSKTTNELLNNTTAGNKVSSKNLSLAKDAADGLYDASSTLVDTSTKSLFYKADSVNDKITSSVKDFVDNYNSVVNTAGSISDSKISGKVTYMTNQTNTYKDSLSKIGISINSDKTLSINEDTLKKASVSDVKNVFNGTNSLGYQTFVRASAISRSASDSATQATYNSYGLYNSANYSTNNWYL